MLLFDWGQLCTIRRISNDHIEAACVLGSEGLFDGDATRIFHIEGRKVVVLAIGLDILDGVVEVLFGVDVGDSVFPCP